MRDGAFGIARIPAGFYAAGMRNLFPSSRWIWFILAAATLLRLAYFREIRTRADFRFPGLDAGYHDYWARGLAFGQWAPPPGQPDPMIRTQPYFRPPGYPYFLAMVYRLMRGRYGLSRLVQFGLGVLNVWLAFWFARRWFGERPGWIAAALAATYWVFIYYEGELLEPVWLVTLLWGLLIALGEWQERRDSLWLLVAGAALGLAALVRPNALVFVPVLAIWLWWRLAAPGRAARAMVLLLAAAAVFILPVTLRNYLVARDVVLISSNGGINLLLGQDREAVANHASSDTGNWNCFNYPELLAQASAEAGHPLKASEASAWYARKARALIVGRPRETLKLLGLKTLLFWGPHEVANNKIEELERADSAVLRRLPVSFSLVLAWALVGIFSVFVRARGRPEEQRAVTVTVLAGWLLLAWFVSFLPFIAAGQYRAPVTPWLMVLAAVGLEETGRRLWRRERGAAIWLAGGLVVWAAVGINYAGYGLNDARWRLTRGVSLERSGALQKAEAEYRAALAANPDLEVVYGRMAVVLAMQERYAEALPWFEKAAAAQPSSVEARFNLGLALALGNRVPEAIPHFEFVLQAQPGHADARHNLIRAYEMTGRPEDARRWRAP